MISTFGLITGDRLFKWGCHGVDGIRLQSVELDRARIRLTFGDESSTNQAELFHGLTTEEDVAAIRQRLWRETGVTATVTGWTCQYTGTGEGVME